MFPKCTQMPPQCAKMSSLCILTQIVPLMHLNVPFMHNNVPKMCLNVPLMHPNVPLISFRHIWGTIFCILVDLGDIEVQEEDINGHWGDISVYLRDI